MPFKSKAQERAAFSGALGAKMQSSAKEWASKTDQKSLLEHVSRSNYKQHFTEGGVPSSRSEHFQKGNAIEGREKGLTDCGAC